MIEQLKQEIEELYANIMDQESLIAKKKEQLVLLEYGVKVGDKIKDEKGNYFIVTGSSDGHFLSGHKIKKDGTPSLSVQNIYDIERLK